MENIKIGLQIDSNTKSETADAKKLHDQLKQAADAASKIKVGGAAKAAAQPASKAMQAAQPVGSEAVREYGALRGTAEQTGASARDFANQSQGLSGLVRLYAIYAANLYAVTAAFGALSRAVDTANLTKGMEQLGAQSGTSLGTLSQGLVAATGYAINLREAMQATVKVTAAGLGASQVERLGKVATNASQALGVDINDAISRLSRGITKLEPELLDELGLFTKLEESTEKYARSVGKTAGQITDFEKRQAFANAVLAEGEKKFGSLQLDANPYNKLTASLSNLVQQGLEFTNKFLIPVIDLLSRSPSALAGAIAAVGFTILKQAVPALTSLREGLQQKAGTATQAAAQKAQESIALRKKLSDEMIKIAETQADKELAAVVRAENKMMELRQKGVKMGPGLTKAFGKAEVTDVSERELRGIEAESRRLAKAGETEKAEFYAQSAKAIRDSKNAELEYAKVRAANISEAEKDISSKRSIIGLNQKMAESLEKASVKSSIVANAAYAGSLIGTKNALKLLNAEIKENNITGISKGMLLARGSIAAVGGALSTLGSYLSGALMWFGLIAAILPVVIGFFSKTAEESQKTSEALKGLDTSTKTLTSTLEVINKKPILEQFNAESVQARANAIGGLAEQVAKVVETSNKELEKIGTSTTDQLVNWVKKLWNGDVESKTTETISKGLASAVAGVDENSEAGKAFIASIKNITKIEDISSFEKLKSAIEKLPDSKTALAQLSSELTKLGDSGKISAAKLTELEESFKKVREARTKFVNENIPKDSFTEYGNALIETFFKLDLALKDPQQNLQAVIRLSEELKNVAAPKELIVGLNDLANSSKQLQVLNKEVFDIDKNITKLSDELERLGGSSGITSFEELNNSVEQLSPDVEKLILQINDLKKQASGKTELQIKLRTQLEGATKQLEEAQYLLLEKGSQAVATRLAGEFAKAGTTVTSAIAGILSGTQAGIEMKARVDKAMLQAQLAGLRAQEALIKAQVENTVALKEQTLKKVEEVAPGTEGRQEEIDRIKKEIAASRKLLSGGSFASFTQNLPKGDIQGMQATISQAQALEGTRAAIANVVAQIQAVDLQKVAQLTEQAAQSKLKGLEADLKVQQLQRDQLASTQAISSSTNEQAVIARQQADASLKAAQDAYKLEEARVKIQVFEQVLTKAKNDQDRESIRSAITAQEKLVSLVQSSRPQELANQELKNQIELIKVRSAQQAKSNQVEFDAETRRLQAVDDALQVTRERFELDKQRFQLTEKFVVQEQAEQDRAQARAKAARELFEAEKLRRTQIQEQESRRQQVLAEGVATGGITQGEAGGFVTPEVASALSEVDAEIVRINSNYTTATQRTQQLLTNTLNNVVAQEQLNLKQAEYNLLLENVSYITDSIRGAFEGLGDNVQRFGTGLADFTDTFAKFAVDSQKSTDNIKALQDASNQAEIAGNYELAGKYAKEAGEATKKQQKDELAGYAKLAGGAKKMFGEKTAAAKLFGAIEKAIHIAKLASNAKEMVSNLLSAKTGVAASIMKAVAAGKAAIANAFNLTPPLGFAAGAAMTAIIAGLLGSAFSGSKGGSAPAITAEQRQETQGTAMGFNAAGEKTQVRRGVFGDTEAKSESIANSLEAIKDSSVLGLSNDTKVVKALEKINRTLETSAQELYRIEGLRAGSAIGTVEGTKTSGITGLFGKTTTTDIIDSGLKLQGTFLELAKASGGVVQGFETVKTTTKKSGFLGIGSSTRTNVTTNTFGLDPKALRAIQDALGGGFEVISALGEQAGLAQSTIESQLANVRVDELVSLRGLKGEELQKELSSVVSAILDDASFAVFQSFEQFAKFGEGMLETVSRVTDTNLKVEAALQNLTGNAQDLSFELTETIAQNFGGVKQFTESIQQFTDRFLSDAERLKIQRTGLQRELDKLGYGYVKTKDDFKSAIQSLIDSGQAGSELFASMMKLQDAMLAVDEATKQTTKNLQSAYDSRVKELQGARDEFKKFAESLRDYRQSLLTGSLSPLTPAQQYLQTQLEYERIRGLAQAGDKDAIQKLQGAASAFLQSSQRMYASSAEYVQDFDRVTQDITSVSNYADSQASLADQTLTALQDQFRTLVDISVNTEKAAIELTGLGPNLAEALNAYKLSGAAMGMAFDTGGVRKYARGGVVTGITPFQHQGGLGIMGEAGPEAIMPLQRMPGGNLGVQMSGDFGKQLAKLNQQVAELTQAVAAGAVMNAQATDRNTVAVVEAVGNTAETADYKNKLTNRMQIV